MTGVTAAQAAALASGGLYVFPCRPGDKRPALDAWERRACADPAYVAAHWPGGFNAAVACGPTGLLVVDLDVHGELPEAWRQIPGVRDGRDVFAWLCEQAGEAWPVTRWTSTPRGGWHLWFRQPAKAEPLRNTSGKLGPMVDTRGAGGYILVPPSEVGGRRYEVLDGCQPAPLPGWLHRALLPPPPPSASTAARPPGSTTTGSLGGRLRGLADHVRSGTPGDRNGRLFWAACRLGELLAAGDATEADADLLVSAALDAGLRGGEAEARNTVKSGLATGVGR